VWTVSKALIREWIAEGSMPGGLRPPGKEKRKCSREGAKVLYGVVAHVCTKKKGWNPRPVSPIVVRMGHMVGPERVPW